MKQLFFLLLILTTLSGCLKHRMPLPKAPEPPPPQTKPEIDYTDVREYSYRSRSEVPAEQNRYEGSLWQDESSWGNLLRDHRARFKHDVVTIVNLQELIVVPKPEPKPVAPTPAPGSPAATGEAAAAQANKALDILQAASGRDTERQAEEEQNEVLSSLKTISARVTNVLPNGNMVILGEKVDYRQQNSIRYVTKIRGVIRPEDVTEKNEIESLKLASSEVKIKRQVQARKLNLGALAPVIGGQKAGFLDRLSHLATPNAKKKTAPVTTTK